MDFDSARKMAGLRYIWEEKDESPFKKPVPAGENGVADTKDVALLIVDQMTSEDFLDIFDELPDDAL